MPDRRRTGENPPESVAVRFARCAGARPLAGALIVTAELTKADFAWLDDLRRRHYPPGLGYIPAHLTLLRALPPSAEAEARQVLARAAEAAPPRASLAGVMELSAGVALRVRSGDLDRLRQELVERFHGLLASADAGGWIPHVTLQNHVEPKTARALRRALEAGFTARPLSITGLGLIRYAEGAWQPLGRYPFRGG